MEQCEEDFEHEIGEGEACPYCGCGLVHKQASAVSPGRDGWVLTCERYPICDSYVGCHQDTMVPLGTIANRELRLWRVRAHEAFDAQWRGAPGRRPLAYERLARDMGLTQDQAHIGLFTIEQCKKVVAIYGQRTPLSSNPFGGSL